MGIDSLAKGGGSVFKLEKRIYTASQAGDVKQQAQQSCDGLPSHCHDLIHGGQSELSELRGTHDKSQIN
jgi:hypothetical protein